MILYHIIIKNSINPPIEKTAPTFVSAVLSYLYHMIFLCVYLFIFLLLKLKITCKQYLVLFFISSNLLIMLKTIKRILYSFINLHNPNHSMFKTKTHNAYIIMINKSLI